MSFHRVFQGNPFGQSEAWERFDRWYHQDGHWIYSSKEHAVRVWRERGIEGLPRYPGPRHGNPVDPEDYDEALTLSDVKFHAKSYGFSAREMLALAGDRSLGEYVAVIDAHERWREQNGLPAKSSPLSHGHLRDMLRGGR